MLRSPLWDLDTSTNRAAGTGSRTTRSRPSSFPGRSDGVSSRSADGVLNLAPYSFFSAFTAAPPIVGFASNGWKDSVANIDASGEFCWHLADYGLASRMNLTSASLPAQVDEFAAAGVYDTAAGDPVLRAGGPGDYFRIGADGLFRMRRPRAEDLDVDR